MSYVYPSMKKSFGALELKMASGSLPNPGIVVVVGKEGTGKTAFIRMLAGQIEGDGVLARDTKLDEGSSIKISYKPQLIYSSDLPGTVEDFLKEEIPDAIARPEVITL